jgi:hypothetical protein
MLYQKAKAHHSEVETKYHTLEQQLDHLMKMPVFTGALGSTDIARKYWESFAIGAAISGISLVVGENVCGIDPRAEFYKDGRIKRSPEMERRIKIYKDWQEEYGDIIVQLNVEDTAFGVAEYVVEKLGVETIELKWGQGAKCIGGEIKIRDLDRALELQKRGYIITPNPSIPAVCKPSRAGASRSSSATPAWGSWTRRASSAAWSICGVRWASSG